MTRKTSRIGTIRLLTIEQIIDNGRAVMIFVHSNEIHPGRSACLPERDWLIFNCERRLIEARTGYPAGNTDPVRHGCNLPFRLGTPGRSDAVYAGFSPSGDGENRHFLSPGSTSKSFPRDARSPASSRGFSSFEI